MTGQQIDRYREGLRMNNEELLTAISDIIDQKLDQKLDEKLDQKLDEKFDQKLQPIYARLDNLELKQDRTMKKLDDFQLDMKVSERNINRNIHKLQDEMDTVVNVLKLHELVPVMNE